MNFNCIAPFYCIEWRLKASNFICWKMEKTNRIVKSNPIESILMSAFILTKHTKRTKLATIRCKQFRKMFYLWHDDWEFMFVWLVCTINKLIHSHFACSSHLKGHRNKLLMRHFQHHKSRKKYCVRKISRNCGIHANESKYAWPRNGKNAKAIHVTAIENIISITITWCKSIWLFRFHVKCGHSLFAVKSFIQFSSS